MADVVRDPLYGPIPLDGTARRLIDTPAFQRLRRIRQLAEAHTVYPSAMHTRFEHAVGVYHLSREILRRLGERGDLAGIDPGEVALVPHAALLHDLGHHVGAHLLEEFGWPGISHEATGAALFTTGDIGRILGESGIPDAAARVAELVSHEGAHPLGGIVSGACDADKLDYLVRDAYHCGLPVGFDQPHLAHGLCVLTDPATGALTIGLDGEALASFEMMLVSKSALFRNVYFHPVVRCAMVMLRAVIVTALDGGLLDADELKTWTDDEVYTILRLRVRERRPLVGAAARVAELTERLAARRLYTRVAAVPLSAIGELSPDRVVACEARLASEVGLADGELLVDIPRKPTMLSTDILVRLASGRVVHASALGPDDGFALNAMQHALYEASGRISAYAVRPVALSPERLIRALQQA